MESASTQEEVTAVNARSASRLMQEVPSVRVNILLHLIGDRKVSPAGKKTSTISKPNGALLGRNFGCRKFCLIKVLFFSSKQT